MTRTPDSNTEKLNELYAKRDILKDIKEKLHADADIFLDAFFADFSPRMEAEVDSAIAEAKTVGDKIAKIQVEIDKLLDADI